jgi:uncharacterized membrane protein/rubredoxin
MALIRCKSCGYVMEESKLKDACPACGVPRKMFEPFTDTVSEKRKRILNLDIHPIIVHFAVSFAVSALVMALFILVFPGVFVSTARGGLRVLGGVLPLVLIATFLSGRFDGRIRFRKAKSRLLRIKTWVGITYFVFSAAAAAIILLVGPHTLWVRVVDPILFAACTACAFIQGRIGARLLYALFPG